jgi:elongation factor Ts
MAAVDATLVKTLRDKTGAGVIACRNALAETAGDLEAAIERLREAELLNAAKKADRVAVEGLVAVAIEGQRGAIVELNTETDFVARNEAFRHAAAALARIALAVNGDRERLLSAGSPDGDGRVADLISRLSARTGERVALRRAAVVSAPRGTVSSYVHNAVAPGVGAIGVLVALESRAPAGDLGAFGHALAMHIAASAPLWKSREDVPFSVVAEKRAELGEQARRSGKPAAIVEKMIEGRMRKFFDEVVLGLQPYVVDPDQTVVQALQEAERAVGAPIAVTAFARFKVGEISGGV